MDKIYPMFNSPFKEQVIIEQRTMLIVHEANDKTSKDQVNSFFKARPRMPEIKTQLQRKMVETQEHILETCEIIHGINCLTTFQGRHR